MDHGLVYPSPLGHSALGPGTAGLSVENRSPRLGHRARRRGADASTDVSAMGCGPAQPASESGGASPGFRSVCRVRLRFFRNRRYRAAIKPYCRFYGLPFLREFLIFDRVFAVFRGDLGFRICSHPGSARARSRFRPTRECVGSRAHDHTGPRHHTICTPYCRLSSR